MMRGYNELYLSDAMKNLGDMVEYAVCTLKYEPDEFFDYFVASGIAEKFGEGNPKYVSGMSGYELADLVLCEVKNEAGDKESVCVGIQKKGREYWSGWILAYYQWITGRRFEDIIRDGLTLSKIFSMYILHEADVSKFVQTADDMIVKEKEKREAKLAKIRKARGLTQSELAKISGVSLRMIQLYEQKQNDINKAQTDTVLALSKTLGCDIEDILDR